MKSITIKKTFGKVITLILGSKSQDVMLINETSPAMVRFLGTDNRFRTFQLSDLEDVTEIKLTKSDDPKKALDVLADFIRSCDPDDENDTAAQKAKAKKFKEQQAEAVAHRKALGTPAPKKEEAVTPKKEAKAKAKAPVKRKKATKKSKAKPTKKSKK